MTTPRLRIVGPGVHPSIPGHPAIARLEAVAEVVLHRDAPADADDLAARMAGAHVLLNPRPMMRLDAALFDRLPDLRLIAVMGVGVDNIDLAAASERGIIVSATAGVNAASVAEHTIALVLALARQLVRADGDVRAGQWRRRDGMELAGKTLGVIGLGPIGGRVARMGRALGMNVLAWTRTPDPARAAACGALLVEQETLLREADAVCLCVAAVAALRHLINAETLALMKPGALLVNTARGSLIDEPALIEALRTGRLGGAGLDVFEREPLPLDSPLRSLDNVILSAHAAWGSPEALERVVARPGREHPRVAGRQAAERAQPRRADAGATMAGLSVCPPDRPIDRGLPALSPLHRSGLASDLPATMSGR